MKAVASQLRIWTPIVPSGRRVYISISIQARRWRRPANHENRSVSHICQPYFARNATRARSIDWGSVTMRAIASRHTPRMRPDVARPEFGREAVAVRVEDEERVIANGLEGELFPSGGLH